MTEEEKKAIWYFSEILTYKEDIKQWKVIENLIEKQKKEIEELKKPKFIFNAETGVVTKLENDCIGNDKIRNKINELTLKNKIPIKDQFVMYDVIKRNFQIEILEEILNEEGEQNAK